MAVRRPVATVLAALLVVLLTGCGGTTASTGDPAQPGPTFDALADPASIPARARERLGEQVTVRRVTLHQSGFSMEVRDNTEPDNIDRYSYSHGRWSVEPVSVSVSDIESFDQTTFGIGTIDWAAIPDLQRRALAGLDLEDERVTSVSVDRIAGDPPRIYIHVSGARGSGSLISDGQGKNVVIRRH